MSPMNGMENDIHIIWQKHKKGFILSYFLIVFCFLVSLTINLAIQDYHKAKSISNLKEIYHYFNDETLVIQDIKKQLEDETLENGQYQIWNVLYDVVVDHDVLCITVLEPNVQEITIHLQNDGKSIFSYDVFH